MRARFSLGLALALSLSVEAAQANGRFPRAERLKELSPDTLLLSGTYGLLVTSNGGKDWHFVCESLLFGRSARGSWIDPLFELLADGTIVSGSPHALRVSRDLGCSFETETALPVDPSFFSDQVPLNDVGKVIDLTPVGARGPGHLVALTTLNDAEGRPFEHRLYRTSDGARSWQAFGSAIPAAMAGPVFTIDVAPSDPLRLYVSAASGTSFVLLRSDDEGLTWDSSPIAVDDEGGADGAYIAGVSPSNPERLYVRVPRWLDDPEEGVAFWDDSLLFSEDGGRRFSDVLRRRGNLLGFALSPDGTSVLVGFGDPNVAPIFTDGASLGLYRAAVTDHAFEQLLPSVPVSCLTWTEGALYVCAREYDPLGMAAETDFHLARSTASTPGEADFVTLLKLKDVRGPAPWSDGRPNECAAEWLVGDPSDPEAASVCRSLNACEAASVSLSAGAVLCSPGAEGGAAGAGGEAGGGSLGQGGAVQGGSSGAGASGTTRGSAAASDGSCACRSRGRSTEAGLLIAAALIALSRARKRSRASG